MNNKTILAIDDETTCLEVITFSLEALGYKVLTAKTGDEGLQLVKNHFQEIDLILLDMMLPDMYGLTTLQKIKKIKKASTIPVVVQTGSSNYDDLKKAAALGAVNYIIRKPYCRGDLVKAIELALKASSAENQPSNDDKITFKQLSLSGAIQEI